MFSDLFCDFCLVVFNVQVQKIFKLFIQSTSIHRVTEPLRFVCKQA
uniref:Uncharacterized protein n=1 Tax=Pseudomonas aeruginosa TaxID=287 RepID=A0A2L1KFK5_PSEAI|nr:Hypothetical protein [Pseudomonas aeruginosa]